MADENIIVESVKKEISQKPEIVWNIINSLLAGFIFFLGAASSAILDHGFSKPQDLIQGMVLGLISALVVAAIKFKDYWSKEESQYSKMLFSFFG